jgi:hypothetical protein
LVGIGDWEEREVGSGSGDGGGAEDGPGEDSKQQDPGFFYLKLNT